MNRPSPAPAPKAKSLAQQQSDFTSEGSPPPGKVATTVPETEEASSATPPCALVTAPAALPAPAGKGLVRQLAVASLLAVPLASSAASILANGSFELDPQAAASWSTQQVLTGWTGGQYGIELRNNVAGAAYDGVNYVELDTSHNSQMLQQVATSLGEALTLSFAYAPREGVAEGSNGIEVLWNGLSQGVFTGNGALSGNAWTLESLVLTGAADTSTLLFRAVGRDDSYGGALDAVSLTRAVPEPGTLALAFAGLGAAGLVVRRRRSDQAR
jgi:hypothetical protein